MNYGYGTWKLEIVRPDQKSDGDLVIILSENLGNLELEIKMINRNDLETEFGSGESGKIERRFFRSSILKIINTERTKVYVEI